MDAARHSGGGARSARDVRGTTSARWLVPAALVLLFLLTFAPSASAAVSLTRAELSGSRLRIEGRGALPNTRVTVNGGQPSVTSNGSGAFRIESRGYTPRSDCRVTVSDGSTSATATLSGCTPSSPPPQTLAAPTPLAPANGASVSVPFTISWTAVTHPSRIAGYNWEVSTSSSFSVVTLRDSTAGTVTEDTIAGLANKTYFWRVQAVSDEPLQQGPWSAARSFTVAGTTGLAAPTLSLVHGTQFHPWESFGFSWSAVEGAALYELQWSRDATFPAGSTFKIDNIEDLRTALTIGDHCGGCEQGTYFARVYALDANRVAGQRSNVVSWTISYDAPLAPAAGATLTLPIELRWSDAPNPQPMGYEVEVSRNSSFTDIEVHAPQLTNPRTLLLSLTAGTKFWRVRHGQGMSSPTTAAFTEWSQPASFTIPGTPPALQAVWLGGPPCENPCTDRVNSGQEIEVSIQLTVAAPAGGVVVTLTSSNPGASGSHPSSVTVPGGTAFTTFRLIAGSVAEPTQVTLTGTLGSSSASAVFTVHPPAVKRLSFCCDTTGGFELPGFLELTGRAPAGGIVVELASDSPAASPPATVTVPEGQLLGSRPDPDERSHRAHERHDLGDVRRPDGPGDAHAVAAAAAERPRPRPHLDDGSGGRLGDGSDRAGPDARGAGRGHEQPSRDRAAAALRPHSDLRHRRERDDLDPAARGLDRGHDHGVGRRRDADDHADGAPVRRPAAPAGRPSRSRAATRPRRCPRASPFRRGRRAPRSRSPPRP